MRPAGEPDLFEQFRGALARPSRRAPGEQGRKLHVFLGGQFLHQVECLEDEADVVAAEPGQCPFGVLVDAPACEPQLTAAGPVQAAEQVKEG
jgi:hypothetical protein